MRRNGIPAASRPGSPNRTALRALHAPRGDFLPILHAIQTMTWWEAALLGLIQGITEFLPVSSSGHLVLARHGLGLEADLITFEVFVHFGTLLSIATVYRNRILDVARSVWEGARRPAAVGERYRGDEHFRLAIFILLSMIPTGILYLSFREPLEAAFSSPHIAAGMLLVTGTLLLLTRMRRRPEGDMSAWKALVTGAAQGLAMIPGISRSGATICVAIYQNVRPAQAVAFSFLMSAPVIAGAAGVEAIGLAQSGNLANSPAILLGALVAYISGVWAIKTVIHFVQRGNLIWFAWYCFLAGGLGLWWL